MVVDQVDGEDAVGLLERVTHESADVIGLGVHFGELLIVTDDCGEFVLVPAFVVLDNDPPLGDAVLHEEVVAQVSVLALADELVGGGELSERNLVADCLHAGAGRIPIVI